MNVDITGINIFNNPTTFTQRFKFQVYIQCVKQIPDGLALFFSLFMAHSSVFLTSDLEWKIIYIGSPESTAYDQELESVMVGPIALGQSMFELEADPPNPQNIPPNDLLGITAILITCHYREQEFIRVGYYLKNEYTDQELIDNPPQV